MYHIRNLPHYMYSMYHDIKTYKFVRKMFMNFLGYIGIAWAVTLFMFVAVTHSGEVYINPYFPAGLMTGGGTIGWFMFYFSNYYPMIQSVYKETELQEKYSYLYTRFMKVD